MKDKISISIDESKCAKDEFCLAICPMGLFAMVDGKITVAHPENCIRCMSCVNACLNGAISVREVED